MSRTNIKNELVNILEELDIFYKVYKENTDIEKEKSFPIAWIYVGPESINDGEMSTTNYMRSITVDITIGTRHQSTADTDMDNLIDLVFDTLKSNYTINGEAINLTPLSIMTDQGFFHPYALATLSFQVLTR